MDRVLYIFSFSIKYPNRPNKNLRLKLKKKIQSLELDNILFNDQN